MDRHQKLQTLKKKYKPLDQDKFVNDLADRLDKSVDNIRSTIDQGISLNNLDDLLENLNILQSFQHEVKELKSAISSFEFPADINIQGIEALTKATDALIKATAINKHLTKLQQTFDIIKKAVNDDIYARYDWANSGIGPAGQYIGYLSQTGSWFIQRVGQTQSGDKSSTFAAGEDDYKQNWNIKEQLKYQSRDKVIIV